MVRGIVRHATMAVQKDPAISVHVSQPTFSKSELRPRKQTHCSGGSRATHSMRAPGANAAATAAATVHTPAARMPSKARRRGTERNSGSRTFSTSTAFTAKPRDAEKQRPQPRSVSPASLAPTARPAPRRPTRPPSIVAQAGCSRAMRATSRGVVMVSVFHRSVFVATFVRWKEAYHATCTVATNAANGTANANPARCKLCGQRRQRPTPPAAAPQALTAGLGSC
mmetsp:Transcript_146682/g.372296  ORF Transcript_146682/g.372296 Transcript_146682/m.372296 type:complete len:225 (+) Transcript_146682:994-1668(+)